ncbi:MAG TPA: dolichol kinase [Thermoplasmatales archaeon]|nr:dolichol kinase [Thermoplasmatales archaeon]
MNSEEKVFAHWYRRAVHAFSATFLLYYLLPDVYWLTFIKRCVVVFLVVVFTVFEVMRIRKLVRNHKVFGLRDYEENRFGSYLYFGVGAAVLLLVFPQQIAVPSILCAAFVDPVVGELRVMVGEKKAYILGFLLSFFFFSFTWFMAPFPFLIVAPVLGALGAVVGEMKKFRWVDDDLLIQLIPATLLGVLYVLMVWYGVRFLPPEVIHPLPPPSWLV